MDKDQLQDRFNQALSTNLAERKRLAKESVQKLYTRRSLEQGFLECFELVGGVPRLALWANDPENYGDFLKLLLKFAPKEATEQVGQVLEYRSNVPQSALNREAPTTIEHGSANAVDNDGDQ